MEEQKPPSNRGGQNSGRKPSVDKPQGGAPRPVQEYLYDAFISYRHVEPDRSWAKWLHSALETYRVPQRLRKQRRLPARLRKVFRDEEELPASADLNKEIEKALRLSRFLIVICSPHTPESEWVNKEVVRFRQLGRHDKILALLIDGEPGESFPRALREIRRKLVDAQGNARIAVEQVEPLAADVRPSRRDESPRHLKRMARLRMLACILGVNFDDLRQRDQERFVRQMIATVAGTGVLAVVLIVLGFFAIRESNRAEQATIAAEKQKALVAKQKALVVEKEALVAEQKALVVQQEALVAKQKALVVEKEQVANEKEQEALFHDRLKRQEIYVGNMKKAWNAWQQNDIAGVNIELDKYAPSRSVDNAQLRGIEWYYLKMLLTTGHQTIRFGGDVHAACFSPDGKHIAAIGTDGGKQCVKVWKLPSGQFEHTLQLGPMTNILAHDAPWTISPVAGRQGVAYSPDGMLVAGTCLVIQPKRRDGVVKVWETQTAREIFTYSNGKIAGHAVKFTPDGKHLLAGGYDGRAFVWSLADKKLAWELSPFDGAAEWREGAQVRPTGPLGLHSPVTSIFFNPEGTAVTRMGPDFVPFNQRKMANRATSMWPPTGDPKRPETRTRAAMSNQPTDDMIAYSPNGHWAVAPVEQLESVRLFDLRRQPRASARKNDQPATVAIKNGRIQCVAICDFYLALAGQGSLVELGHLDFNGHALTSRKSLSGHVGDVRSLAFSLDHTQLAAAGSEMITIWPTDVQPEEIVFDQGRERVRGSPETLGSPEFSVDYLGGRYGDAFFATPVQVGEASHVTVIDEANSKVVARFETTIQRVSALSASLDRMLCAVAGEGSAAKSNGEIQLFDTRLGPKPHILHGHTDRVDSLMFDSAGRRLLSASFDGTVRIWDLADKRERRVFQMPAPGPGRAEFVGDGAWIVASDPKTIVVWPADGGDPHLSIEKVSGAGGGWCCSRDGSLLASCEAGNAISIWDLKKKLRLRGLSTNGSNIAFSVDGSRLLTHTSTGVTIWSVDSGEDIFMLPATGWTGDLSRFATMIQRLEQEWKAILDAPAQ